MTIKLAVFDIDGTLAKTENTIPFEVSSKLQAYENRGLKIALISGRNASYLAGLARGMGLKEPLVAGENGGVIFSPNTKEQKILDYIPERISQGIKNHLLKKFPNLWFQPNQTMISALPKKFSEVEKLYEVVKNLESIKENNYKMNTYYDSVEIMPAKNNKGRALAVIKKILGFSKKEVAVFGNTKVDLPMKDEAEVFFLIGDEVQEPDLKNYPSIEEAFKEFDQLLN
ncbi:MAG: HAD family hydrolase [Desulfitobacteriia bacterium]|jgi:HAD superfamily hydrolase (TIGR01484 family)